MWRVGSSFLFFVERPPCLVLGEKGQDRRNVPLSCGGKEAGQEKRPPVLEDAAKKLARPKRKGAGQEKRPPVLGDGWLALQSV